MTTNAPAAAPAADPADASVGAPDATDATDARNAAAPAMDTRLPLREWRALPARAYRVFLIVSLIVTTPPAIAASVVLYRTSDTLLWLKIVAVWTLALSLAVWTARRRHRYTFWLLDDAGFAVRRGRMWQWETRVPTSRVQHLDLKRGPIERAHGLASLVLHTAGTRLSAVSISGLEDADAEALRDHFSRQIDRQDDDEHA